MSLNLQRVETLALELLKRGRRASDGEPKDIAHTLRVRDKALKIARVLSTKYGQCVDLTVVEAAALLHDVGWSYVSFEDDDVVVGAHCGAGARVAFEIVLECGG